MVFGSDSSWVIFLLEKSFTKGVSMFSDRIEHIPFANGTIYSVFDSRELTRYIFSLFVSILKMG